MKKFKYNIFWYSLAYSPPPTQLTIMTDQELGCTLWTHKPHKRPCHHFQSPGKLTQLTNDSSHFKRREIKKIEQRDLQLTLWQPCLVNCYRDKQTTWNIKHASISHSPICFLMSSSPYSLTILKRGSNSNKHGLSQHTNCAQPFGFNSSFQSRAVNLYGSQIKSYVRTQLLWVRPKYSKRIIEQEDSSEDELLISCLPFINMSSSPSGLKLAIMASAPLSGSCTVSHTQYYTS